MAERLSLSPYEIACGSGFLYQTSVQDTYPLHTHDFYEVFFVTSGYAIHIINEEKIVVSQGSYVFIRPEDLHQYDYLKSYDFGIISIGIPVNILQQAFTFMEGDLLAFHNEKIPPMLIMDGREAIEVQYHLEKIGRLRDKIERRRYFLSILPTLLYPFMSQESKQPKDLPSWFLKLLEDMNIEENFIEGLPKLLVLANCSQEHMTRLFQQYLNITPTAFINEKRLELAYTQVLYSTNSIMEVALSCGFHNTSHFHHLFKKQYKQSPNQLRKQSKLK